MKIIVVCEPAEQKEIESRIKRLISPYVSGDPAEFVFKRGAWDIAVEGAKYIASQRLQSQLRQELRDMVP